MKDDLLFRWDEVEQDNPIPLLFRKRVMGEKMMLAKVTLQPGCNVATHCHESEQMAVVLSGQVIFRLGAEGAPDRRDVEVRGGEVMFLPSNMPHGVDAIEETLILDVLAPPGAMGVDRQAQGG